MGPQQEYNSFSQYQMYPGQYPGPQGQYQKPRLPVLRRFFDLWGFLVLVPVSGIVALFSYLNIETVSMDQGFLLLFLFIGCIGAVLVGLIGSVVAVIRGLCKWNPWITWAVVGVTCVLPCIPWLLMPRLFDGYLLETTPRVVTYIPAFFCFPGAIAAVIGLLFSAGVRTK